MTSTEPADTAPSIGFLLQRAHNLLRVQMMAALSDTGLHLGHIAILATALGTPGLSQRELSARTGIEKSSMVLFVDSLERDGLLRRAPHPTDRRTHALFVTDRGAAFLARTGPKLNDVEASFLSPLSPREHQALAENLAKLLGSAD